MKFFSLVILLSFLFLNTADAQKKGKKGDEPAQTEASWEDKHYELHRGAFDRAVAYADFNTAISSIYYMLELRPSNIALKDTLALLFFNSGQYGQALLVGEEVLANNPTQEQVLEIVASSEQSLGMPKEALKHYETLYGLTEDIYHLYKIGTLQFSLKRFGECSATLEKIINAPDTQTQVNISTEAGSENVPVKAAAYNMRGAMALQLNQVDAAIMNFQQALQIHPQFKLAAANLQATKQLAEQPKAE